MKIFKMDRQIPKYDTDKQTRGLVIAEGFRRLANLVKNEKNVFITMDVAELFLFQN